MYSFIFTKILRNTIQNRNVSYTLMAIGASCHYRASCSIFFLFIPIPIPFYFTTLSSSLPFPLSIPQISESHSSLTHSTNSLCLNSISSFHASLSLSNSLNSQLTQLTCKPLNSTFSVVSSGLTLCLV
ncbi:hypothetical protein AHAS_Ahas18G0253400 [Arachis hypogaea]